MLDVPKYKARSRPERLLAGKALLYLVLGILLYTGIYVNYFLLSRSIPADVNILFITGIVLLLVIDSILSYMRYGHYTATLYDRHADIEYNKKIRLEYREITGMSYSRNLFDRWLKTGSIILHTKQDKNIKMKFLENPNEMYIRLQKLIKDARAEPYS